MFLDYLFFTLAMLGALCSLFSIGEMLMPFLLYPIYRLDGGRMRFRKYYIRWLKDEF